MFHLDKIVEKAYFPWLVRVTGNPTMLSIRNGLLLTLPLVMAGCVALLINNLPIPAYQHFMLEVFGPEWKMIGFYVKQGTFDIIALLMLYSTSQHLTTYHNLNNPLEPVSPVIAALISFASLIILTPVIGVGENAAFLIKWTGSGGLFTAIVVSLVSTKIFLRLSHIKKLKISLYAEGVDIALPQAISSLIPGIITVFIFGLGKTLMDLAGIESLHQLVHEIVLLPFSMFQDTLGTSAAYVFICQVLWFFGIHGANVLDPITHSFYDQAMAENMLAFASGQPMPHVVTKPFLDVFVYMGGSGSMICLMLAVFLVSRNNSNRRLAQFSFLPVIFNINELILFGLPVILNPVFFIPFVFVPLVLGGVGYLAIDWGLVPGISQTVDWTTPPLIGGYIATGSIRGSLLQCFSLILGTLMYMPFVHISDRVKAERFKVAMAGLFRVSVSNAVSPSGKKCLDRDDEIGALARGLANDLDHALLKGRGLFLEYQPQLDIRTGGIIGTEALVRWMHPIYGMIPPPVIVAISEDANFIERMGLWVLEEACAERKRWWDKGLMDITMSVNLSVRQLDDDTLPEKVEALLAKYQLPVSCLELEVTESVALDHDANYNDLLHQIHQKGVRIAIDDFGMGHSSLLYLTQFPVSTLKIDKALSKDVVHNKACVEIITSIVDLCKVMDVDIVVEFIEDEEQVEILRGLGCSIFQGYLFSRPLVGAKCLEFIQSKNADGISGRSVRKIRKGA